jgi:hypothetical protein
MLEPTRVTEGILPVNMQRDNFFVTGETWSKFHSAHPSIIFDEFWTIKLHTYEKRNMLRRPLLLNSNVTPLDAHGSSLIMPSIMKSEESRIAQLCHICCPKA